MASHRRPAISLNTTPQIEEIDIREWLQKAKLSKYLSIFVRESLTIDELMGFNESELKTIANETLGLSTLHTKRFLEAMSSTKRMYDQSEVYNGASSSTSSSSSASSAVSSNSFASPIIIHRPVSPAVSVQSLDRNRYFNGNASNASTHNQSPSISTKKYHNGHHHHINHRHRPSHHPRSASTQIFSNSKMPKSKSQRFSKQKKRSNTETDLSKNAHTNGHIVDLEQLLHQKSAPNSLNISSSESMDSSIEYSRSKTKKSKKSVKKRRDKKKKKRRKKKVKFKESAFSVPDKTFVGNERSKSFVKSKRNTKITRPKSSKYLLSKTPTLTAINHRNHKRSKHIKNGFKLNHIAKTPPIILSEDEEVCSSENKNMRMSLNSSSDTDNDSEDNEQMHHSDDEKWESMDTNTPNMSIEENDEMNKTLKVLINENKSDLKQIEHGIKELDTQYIESKQQIDAYFDRLQKNLIEHQQAMVENLEQIKNEKHKKLKNKQDILQKHIIKQTNLMHSNDENAKEKFKQMALENDGMNEYDEKDSLLQIEFYDQRMSDLCVIKTNKLPRPPKIKVLDRSDTLITLQLSILNSKEKKEINKDPHCNQSKNDKIIQIEIECKCQQNDHQQNGKREKIDPRIERIQIDQNAKLKRFQKVTLDGLVSKCAYFIRARSENINGWSSFCEILHSEVPKTNFLSFDVEQSSNSNGVQYIDDNKCCIFQQTYQHNIAVCGFVIDQSECAVFEWKYILRFEEEQSAKKKKKKKKKSKKGKQTKEVLEESEKDEVCMGFVGYPLDESVEFMDSQLGRNGNQYGLMVSNDSRSAHVYYTKNDNIHHASEILLSNKVKNEDEFRFLCNMKKKKCQIYHNEELLIDVFTLKIPKKIIPAISGYSVDQSIACEVEFVSSC